LLLLIPISPNLLAVDGHEIYLVRHAEKQNDGTRNPPLSNAGILRANNLAEQLSSKNINVIYSTNYKRTLQTVYPLAKKSGIEIITYSPRKLEELAQKLLNKKTNTLIVGHSQTTPKLVSLLGGKSNGKIGDTEYDRLYRLEFSGKTVITEILTIQPIR
jgi:broad specificity phosphatase PhoE